VHVEAYVNIQSLDLLLDKKGCYCVLLKHVFASHFLILKYDQVIRANGVIFIVLRDSILN
jgi:hypothetical protein